MPNSIWPYIKKDSYNQNENLFSLNNMLLQMHLSFLISPYTYVVVKCKPSLCKQVLAFRKMIKSLYY